MGHPEGAAIRTRNLENDIDPKTGTVRRIETLGEKLSGDGVPWMMQAGMTAVGVAIMATAAPALLLVAVPVAAGIGTYLNRQADASIKELTRGNYTEGNTIYRRYNIDTQHGAMLMAQKYGIKGETFITEYKALAKMAGLKQAPALLMMEPRIRIRNAAAIVRQPPRREAMNAFAISCSDGSHAAVAVGDMFFEELSMAEIRATIAHELTHIRGQHSRMRSFGILTQIANTVAAVGVVASAVIGGMAVLPALGIAVTMYGVTKSAQVMQARYHEKVCDRAAGVISGAPQALASAFKTMEKAALRIRQERENLRARMHGRAPDKAPTQPPLLKRLLADHPDDAIRIGLLEGTFQAHSLSFWRQRQQCLTQAFNECAAQGPASRPMPSPTAEQVGFLRFGQTR